MKFRPIKALKKKNRKNTSVKPYQTIKLLVVKRIDAAEMASCIHTYMYIHIEREPWSGRSTICENKYLKVWQVPIVFVFQSWKLSSLKFKTSTIWENYLKFSCIFRCQTCPCLFPAPSSGNIWLLHRSPCVIPKNGSKWSRMRREISWCLYVSLMYQPRRYPLVI